MSSINLVGAEEDSSSGEADSPSVLRPLTESEERWVQHHLQLAPATTAQQKEDISRLLSSNLRLQAERLRRASRLLSQADGEPYAPDHATRGGDSSQDGGPN